MILLTNKEIKAEITQRYPCYEDEDHLIELEQAIAREQASKLRDWLEEHNGWPEATRLMGIEDAGHLMVKVATEGVKR